MQISSSTTNTSVGGNHTTSLGLVNQDEQIQSLQKQIENVQKQLQSFSNNKEMSPEEMMQKRKELQQQIQDLNKQISQRKIELQQEKREDTKVEKKTDHKASTTRENQIPGESASMQELIGTAVLLKQVNVIQSTKSDLERKAGILESEIQTDRGRGSSTQRKESQLVGLHDRIDAASAHVMDKLSDINTKIHNSNQGQEVIKDRQGRNLEKDESEKNKSLQSDEDEQKSNIHDKPIIYTKNGEADSQEPKANLSVLI